MGQLKVVEFGDCD